MCRGQGRALGQPDGGVLSGLPVAHNQALNTAELRRHAELWIHHAVTLPAPAARLAVYTGKRSVKLTAAAAPRASVP